MTATSGGSVDKHVNARTDLRQPCIVQTPRSCQHRVGTSHRTCPVTYKRGADFIRPSPSVCPITLEPWRSRFETPSKPNQSHTETELHRKPVESSKQSTQAVTLLRKKCNVHTSAC